MTKEERQIQEGQRLQEFLKYLKIRGNKFAKEINVSQALVSQTLTGARAITRDFANKITIRYPDFRESWLFSGEGTMLKSAEQASVGSFLSKEPEMADIERLREAVLEKYKPDSPLTVKQDLTLRQACYRVLADNPGQPWPSLVAGGVAYLRIILSNPHLIIPPDREPIEIL